MTISCQCYYRQWSWTERCAGSCKWTSPWGNYDSLGTMTQTWPHHAPDSSSISLFSHKPMVVVVVLSATMETFLPLSNGERLVEIFSGKTRDYISSHDWLLRIHLASILEERNEGIDNPSTIIVPTDGISLTLEPFRENGNHSTVIVTIKMVCKQLSICGMAITC